MDGFDVSGYKSDLVKSFLDCDSMVFIETGELEQEERWWILQAMWRDVMAASSVNVATGDLEMNRWRFMREIQVWNVLVQQQK